MSGSNKNVNSPRSNSSSSAVEDLLQGHNDLILAIHKSFADSYQTINTKIDNTMTELKDLKVQLSQLSQNRNSKDEMGEWRKHTEYLLQLQDKQHEREVTRLVEVLQLSSLQSARSLPPVQQPQQFTQVQQFQPFQVQQPPSFQAHQSQMKNVPVNTSFNSQATNIKGETSVANAQPTAVAPNIVKSDFKPPVSVAQNVSTSSPFNMSSLSFGVNQVTSASSKKESSPLESACKGNVPAFSNAFALKKESPSFSAASPSANSAVRPEPSILAEPWNDGHEHEEAEQVDEFVPADVYKPVIPLPALVQVKTGEEDEQVLFMARCKLYRFDHNIKENKERGVGEIKLLKHKHTGKCRVVMRRDQTLKVCANFPLFPALSVKPKPNMPTVFSWVCRDFSEDAAGTDEVFLARFKSAETASEYAKKVQEAVGQIST